MKYHIAFIGCGIMGKPMAINLLRAGHRIALYSRRRESAEEAVAHGAQYCATARQAVQGTDFCILMISDTPDVEEVTIRHPDSIIKSVPESCIVIDMSTISPIATRKIAQAFAHKNIAFLDAPVSGGEKGAVEASLSIMVGGPAEAYSRALPIFQALGKTIVHVGPSGCGQIAKACNQLLVAQTMLAVAEAFTFARHLGADPQRVRQALLGGFAYSRILEHHGEKMLHEDYQPGFKARLHLKDLRNTLEAARATGLNLAGLDMTHAYLQTLVEEGDGELDSLAIQKVVASLSRQLDEQALTDEVL